MSIIKKDKLSKIELFRPLSHHEKDDTVKELTIKCNGSVPIIKHNIFQKLPNIKSIKFKFCDNVIIPLFFDILYHKKGCYINTLWIKKRKFTINILVVFFVIQNITKNDWQIINF